MHRFRYLLYSRKRCPVLLADGLSARTVSHAHACLHAALDAAMRWGMLVRNVADLVEVPRVGRVERVTLSVEQGRALLAQAREEDHRWYALFVLELATGLRRGEILGLCWRDVDIDGSAEWLSTVGNGGRVRVRQTVQRTREGLVYGEPKTAGSSRVLDIGASVVTTLREQRRRQHEERLKLGPAWDDQDLVFPNSVGKPEEGGNLLRRELHPLLARAGLPQVRFHDLRHTAATWLLERGVHPKVVSEMLGHTDITITMNLYAHVTPTMLRHAADVLDGLLFGGADALEKPGGASERGGGVG